MIGLFQILRTAVEVFRVEHFDLPVLLDSDGSLDGGGIAGDGKGIVCLGVFNDAQAPLQVSCGDKGGSGVNAADLPGSCAMLPVPIYGMGDDGCGAGVVVGKFWRPHEGYLRAVRTGDGSNLLVVCRYHDAVETIALLSGFYRPGNHGLAAKGLDVLARDAFAASAGGNDGESHACSASRIA